MRIVTIAMRRVDERFDAIPDQVPVLRSLTFCWTV
jgi:hypothetical protein